MPRVSELSDQHLDDADKKVYNDFSTKYGPFRNQVKIFAHRPPALRHIMGLLLELSKEECVPKRYLEIAVVTVSKINECKYYVVHHSPRMLDYGFLPEAAEKILENVVPGFDAIDTLVRDFAIQVTQTPQKIADHMFSRLKTHFSEAQIVELTLRISLCGFFNRFNDTLQIDLEDEFNGAN